MKLLFITFYFGLLALLSVYGIHLYWLLAIYLRNRHSLTLPDKGLLGKSVFPVVTVQLPLFNERSVALRLIDAVRNFDWPPEKLEIQILDDSDDITSELIANHLANLPPNNSGPAIHHIRRNNRSGFKAGALQAGLVRAHGQFLAIFDADNLPRADFLLHTVPFFNDDNVGMVQVRWSFLNRCESWLTRAQSLFLDAHFRIEQQARFKGGLLFNFNGTAGLWRKQAIVEAGGWQHDTLTEDLDLSLRAQLSGSRFIYCDDYDVPTELPNSLTPFKQQQYRWAKGAVQTAIKILPTIFRSSLSYRVKLAAFFHLTHKSTNLILLLLGLTLVPALYYRMDGGTTKLLIIDLPIFVAGTGSMSLFYSLANRANRTIPANDGTRNRRELLILPFLTSLGVALAVNNSKAFLSGLSGRSSEFIRTAKSGSTDHKHCRIPKSYRTHPERIILVEAGLALYALSASLIAASLHLYPTLPFLLTFVIGYSYFTLLGVRDYHAL